MTTFLDHLAELRFKILLSVGGVLLGGVIAHSYHETLISLLLRPLGQQRLVFLSPLDPLLFILKIDLFAGVMLALPIINWSLLSFLKPAMARASWLFFAVMYSSAIVLTVAGLAYAYCFLVPASLVFLLGINVAGIEKMITAASYVNFLLVQSLLIAIVFQIPLILIAGSYIGAFDVTTLASKRRYVYVGGLIALAIITPTVDLFNLGMVAVPTCLMFEGSLVAGRIVRWFTGRSSS